MTTLNKTKTHNSIQTNKYSLAILLAVFLITNLLCMYYTPLFDEDEGFFAEAARHLLSSNDWITITVNGELRFDKPALFYWITAFSLKIFGNNEFAARLPSFTFFLLFVLQIYNFTKTFFNKERAVFAVFIAISILQFRVLSAAAVSDNLLNLWVALGLIQFFKYTQFLKARNLFWVYTYAGLGFLTKGPIAFIIIFGVIFVFLLVIKNRKLILKILNPLLIMWSLIIPLPWFYLAFKKSGEFLFYDFFWKHNFGRFTATMESHGGYFWYYLPVTVIALFPFIHLFFKYWNFKRLSKLQIFLICWFAIPFVLFSFSKTQLPHYISIGYFPLIVAFSKRIGNNYRAVAIQVAVLIVIFLIAPLLINLIPIADKYVTEMILFEQFSFNQFYYLVLCILLSFIVINHLLLKRSLTVVLASYIIATSYFINRFSDLQQGFVKETGLGLQNYKGQLYMNNHYTPSLSFYAQKQFLIKEKLDSGELFFVKFDPKFLSEKYTVLKKSNGYLLLKVK